MSLKEAYFFASLAKFLDNYEPCVGVGANQDTEIERGKFWRFSSWKHTQFLLSLHDKISTDLQVWESVSY